jgi:hypothetical protein
VGDPALHAVAYLIAGRGIRKERANGDLTYRSVQSDVPAPERLAQQRVAVPAASVIHQAEEQGMGVILMRPLTSGVFQRLMADAFLDIDAVASDGRSGPPAAQNRALRPLCGRGAGLRARLATPRAALCGAE